MLILPMVFALSLVTGASDLLVTGEVSSKNHVPIVVYISRSDCTFCRSLEQEVLDPLIRSGAFAQVLFREVELDGGTKLRGFDGLEYDSEEFAQIYGARLTPTILFLDATGRELLPRIVGYQRNDYFLFYLERAIRQATQLVLSTD